MISSKNKTSIEKKSQNKQSVAKKKKKKISSPKGIAHIHSTINNTIVTITDLSGNVINWSSAGSIGYKGTKKATPYAARIAAEVVAKACLALGVTTVDVKVNGIGRGKDAAIRSLATAGLQITSLEDVTPIPHNGCKPPKKPR